MLLTRDDTPLSHYNVIVDESALRHPIGDASVMRAQFTHIVEVARLPRVVFRVIPLGVGAHPRLQSNFVLLEFSNTTVNDVVYVEGAVGNIYLESPADLEILSRLQSIALDPEGSVAMVSRIMETYEAI
jgi:Domain of unknown function (DUF5753)